MDKEEKRSIIRSMPAHRRDMVFNFAVDTCYDWKMETLFTWTPTAIYWFTEKQIKEVIKEAMAMGYKIAKEQEEAESKYMTKHHKVLIVNRFSCCFFE